MKNPDEKRNGSRPRPLLEVDAVSKRFGGIQALRDISFQVAEGAVQAVIGPNGAGKTTLFNVITGLYTPEEGRVRFGGDEIQGRPMHRLVRRGIARTFQNVELFDSMSVLDNVLVGQHVRTRCGVIGAMARFPWVGKEERAARKRGMELLEFVGLEKTWDQVSGDLPFGWQRMVEIARALASDPKLILLDEPASGLNAVETEKLGELILRIRDLGVTIMLVEHDMSLTMEISERIVVLDQGAKLAEGTPREIQADEAVAAAYLGEDI